MTGWIRRLGSYLFAAYVGGVIVTLLILPFEAGWETFVKDYQTLLVGAPGLLAIGIALQQRRLELRRDAINVLKGYEPEFEALDDLQALVEQAGQHRHPSIVGALIGTRSGGHTIEARIARHIISSSQQCKGGIVPKADALGEAIDYFNRLIIQTDAGDGQITDAESEQLSISMRTIDRLTEELLEAIAARIETIRTRINDYLDLPRDKP